MHSNNPSSEVKSLATNLLDADPAQPRKSFDAAELEDLAKSIKQFGILQPLIVRPAEGNRYAIIAGERRWRAAKLAGCRVVPCIIRDNLRPREVPIIQLIENLQRVDLAPIERAEAFSAALKAGFTQEALADRLNVRRRTIANSVRLLDMPKSWRSAMECSAQNIPASETAILELLRLSVFDKVATRSIEDHPYDWGESWSELFGRTCLYADAWHVDQRIRTREGCRKFVDRFFAWLWWAYSTFPPADGHAWDYLADMPVRRETGDWQQAAMLWDDIRPDMERLSESEKENIRRAAERIDFSVDPFSTYDWDELAA